MAKKKILLIHEKFGRYGGAEQNICATTPWLSKSFDIDIAYWHKTSKDTDSFGKPFHSSYQIDFEGDERAIAVRTSEILQDSSPDLVYLHKCASPTVLETLMTYNTPIVRMTHDHETYCMRNYKYFPLSRKICTRKAGPCCIFPCLANVQRDRSKGPYGVSWVSYRETQRQLAADRKLGAFFVATHYMRDELIKQGYPEERIQIHPPVPQDLATTPPSPSFDDDNILVFAGQIIRGKGLDCLLRALTHAKTHFKLIVLGDGSHRSYCEDLAQSLGLKDQVSFEGYIPHEQLQEYYRRATAAIVPSVWPEPFGAVGIEFMRYALPVVGFDSGGISDWLKDGETGYLIPWMDEKAMGDRIEYLLTHKDDARDLGQKAQDYVAKHYNFRDYITGLTRSLEALIK